MSGDRDEKRMVGLNELNNVNLGAKLANQVAKRIDAPPPTRAKVEDHIEVVVAPVRVDASSITAPDATPDNNVFFDAWDTYYPKIVGWLGWSTAVPKWMLPGGMSAALLMIKSLLAVANNDIIPIVKALMQANIMSVLQAILADKALLAEVLQLVERNRNKS